MGLEVDVDVDVVFNEFADAIKVGREVVNVVVMEATVGRVEVNVGAKKSKHILNFENEEARAITNINFKNFEVPTKRQFDGVLDKALLRGWCNGTGRTYITSWALRTYTNNHIFTIKLKKNDSDMIIQLCSVKDFKFMV